MLNQHVHPHQDSKGCPSSEDNNTKQTQTRRNRQSTLPFSRVPKDSTDELTSAPDHQRASIDPTHLSKPSLAAANRALDKQNSSYLLPRHKDEQVKSSPRFKSIQQQTVTQVVRALGGFPVVDQVCENTTHVVSVGHRRTLNILLGIGRVCW
ncbi:unnamed protein product [Coregonus sp. 'balchen']|nr:unnamed protein product [Coregonus sp. 'balchen']